MRQLGRSFKIAIPALLLAGSLVAQTQTNTLTSARPYGWVPGGYVGPYQAQVTSAPGAPFIDVFCVDYNNNISVGDSWTTNVSRLSGDLSKTRFNNQLKYRQAAWLALQFKSTAKTEWASIHGALWNITSPGSPSIVGNPTAQAYLAAAMDVNNYSTINLDEWAVLTDVTTDWMNPVGGVAPGGKQEYLTHVTPEPATMILLGTGLFGVAAARRRRKKGIGDADLG